MSFRHFCDCRSLMLVLAVLCCSCSSGSNKDDESEPKPQTDEDLTDKQRALKKQLLGEWKGKKATLTFLESGEVSVFAVVEKDGQYIGVAGSMVFRLREDGAIQMGRSGVARLAGDVLAVGVDDMLLSGGAGDGRVSQMLNVSGVYNRVKK